MEMLKVITLAEGSCQRAVILEQVEKSSASVLQLAMVTCGVAPLGKCQVHSHIMKSMSHIGRKAGEASSQLLEGSTVHKVSVWL